MKPRTFDCRECGCPHELTTNEEQGCKVSPWKRICQCGAVYQILPDRIHFAAYSTGQRRTFSTLPPLPKLAVLPKLPPLLPPAINGVKLPALPPLPRI